MEETKDLKKVLEKLFGKDWEERYKQGMEKEFGKDWKKFNWKDYYKHYEKEKIEDEKKREKIIRKFNDYKLSFIYKNIDKRFEVTQDVFEQAKKELKGSFSYGDEMGMLMFFEEQKDSVTCEEFYDSNWVFQNDLGRPGAPMTMWIEDEKTGRERRYPLGSFSWNTDKLYEKFKDRKNGVVIPSHTHPIRLKPSKTDLKYSPACTSIIGFVNENFDLKKLMDETYRTKPIWKTIEEGERTIRRRVLFDVNDKIYEEIEKECKPTIRIFYNTDSNGDVVSLPLYVEGKLLE
jgi:hypothetical protein